MAEEADVRSKMQNLIREFEIRSRLASINGESAFSKPSTLSGSNVKKKIEIFNMLSAQPSGDANARPEKSLSSPAVCGRPSSGPRPRDRYGVSSSLPSVFKKAHDLENASRHHSARGDNEKTDLKRWWGLASASMCDSLNKLTSAPSRFLKRRDRATKTGHGVTSGAWENSGSEDTWDREAIELLLSNRSRASCNSSNSSYTNLEIDIFDFEDEEERRPDDGPSGRIKSPRDNKAFDTHDSLLDSSCCGAVTKEDTKAATASPTRVNEDASWTRGAKPRRSIGKLLSMVGSKLKAIGTRSPKKEERQYTFSDSGCERSLSRTDLNGSSLSRSFTDFNSADKEPLALSTPTFTTFGHTEDAVGRHADEKLDGCPATTLAEEEVLHQQPETSRPDLPGDRTPKRPASIEKRKVHFTSNSIRIPGAEESRRIGFARRISGEHPPPPPDVSRLRRPRRRISKEFVALEEGDQTEDEASLTEDEDEEEEVSRRDTTAEQKFPTPDLNCLKTSPECESSILSPPLVMDILNTRIYGRTSSPKSRGFQIEESANEYENMKISFLRRKPSLRNASGEIFKLDSSVSAFANLYQQSEPHRYATVNPKNFNFFMSSKKLQEIVNNCNEVTNY